VALHALYDEVLGEQLTGFYSVVVAAPANRANETAQQVKQRPRLYSVRFLF
jgi:hypothetical protein